MPHNHPSKNRVCPNTKYLSKHMQHMLFEVGDPESVQLWCPTCQREYEKELIAAENRGERPAVSVSVVEYLWPAENLAKA